MPNSSRAVALREVAAAAGVSISTASRALAGRGDLTSATRTRIQSAAVELGYRRHESTGGRPARAESRLIELVLPAFEGSWADEALIGARRAAAEFGYDLVMTSERDDPDDDWPARVAARRSAGVILGIIGPTSRQLNQLAGLNIPIVMLDPRSDPRGVFHSVGTTDWKGGYDVGEHLASAGLRRFIVVTGLPRYRFGKERTSGFEAAIAEFAPGASVATVGSNWGDGDLTEVLAPHVKLGSLPVGVFACNDSMAVGVYKAAKRLGLAIPNDIQVVGFDDTPEGSHLAPPLTSIRQPIREMSHRAVELIQQLRDGNEGTGERTEFECQLIVRGSTRPLA